VAHIKIFEVPSWNQCTTSKTLFCQLYPYTRYGFFFDVRIGVAVVFDVLVVFARDPRRGQHTRNRDIDAL
jgi:hypothetical protein